LIEEHNVFDINQPLITQHFIVKAVHQ